MRIWNIQDNSCRTITISDANSLNDDSGVTSVAISPDGALVAAGSLDTVVRIWDIATGTLLERLRGHSDSVYSVAFTPDGKGIVSGSLDKTLKYWDVSNLVNAFARTKTNGVSTLTAPPSTSTMDFVGHKVRHPTGLFPKMPCHLTLNCYYQLRISCSQYRCRMMAGGFFRVPKIAVCISGTRGLLRCSSCCRGIKIPVSAFQYPLDRGF